MNAMMKCLLPVLALIFVTETQACRAQPPSDPHEQIFVPKPHHLWVMGRNESNPLVLPTPTTATNVYAVVLRFRVATAADADPLNGINEGDMLVDMWGFTGVNALANRYTGQFGPFTTKCVKQPGATGPGSQRGLKFETPQNRVVVTRRWTNRGKKFLIVRFLPKLPPSGDPCEDPPVEDIYTEEPYENPTNPDDPVDPTYYDPPPEP